MRIRLKAPKDGQTDQLVFDMLDILQSFGLTEGLTARRLEKMAKACLAVGGVTTALSEAKSAADGFFLGTREIITFENAHYGEYISSGSYDDIRRQDLAAPEHMIHFNGSKFLKVHSQGNV